MSGKSLAAALLVSSVLAISCSGSDELAVPVPPEAAAEEAPPSQPGSAATQPPLKATDFSPTMFGEDSTTIDNQWLPMVPGTQLSFRGSTKEGKERITHEVVFTVTDLTKEILGVRNRIIWELDYTEGVLVEAELALFAQDLEGNIWHFGQYPEEYENGKFVDAPAWIAGVAGARPGITMKAEPSLDAPSYSQGYAPPPINWIDRARVYRQNQRTCVPVDCYDGVLITEEFEVDKPGAWQLKYYAPGVGNVRVGWRGRNEKERETLVLIEARQLTPSQMEKAHAQILELEAHAYEISKEVYGGTPPAAPIA